MKLSFLTSLRFRVAAAFLLVATIPLGIVSFFAVETAERLVVSIVTNQLENVASDKQELVRRWMAERKADLAVIASLMGHRSPNETGVYLHVLPGKREAAVNLLSAEEGEEP